jgi:hypothetical protein
MMVTPDRRPLTLRRAVAEEVADVVSTMMEAVADAVLVIEEIDHKLPEMEINATMRIVDVIVTMEMVKTEKSPEVAVAVEEAAVVTVAMLVPSKTRTPGFTSTTTWRDKNTNRSNSRRIRLFQNSLRPRKD